MIADLDIYRSANVLIKHHGQDAPVHAAMRADAMLEKGDLDGFAVWKRILRAAEELQREIATSGNVEASFGPSRHPAARNRSPLYPPRADVLGKAGECLFLTRS